MHDFIQLISEPLQYAFMQRGLTAAVLVGVVCAIVGTFVVLRGMAFLGDALAHTILPGVAAGYILGGGARGPVFLWALFTAVASSLAIGFISRRTRLREDAAIGVILSGMFALGIAIISSASGYAVDLTHFLFGDILGVGPVELGWTAVLGALVLLAIFLFHKEFIVVSFDPIFAATLRLPSATLYYALLALVAVTIVVALQTAGVAMMLALLVTPPAAARLLTRRVPSMMSLAAAIGAASGAGGLYASYYLGIASGAAIVLTATAFFLLAAAIRAFKRHQGRNG